MKYPEFSDEFDLEAFEVLLYHICKHLGHTGDNAFFAGLLYRCSPHFRCRVATKGHAFGNALDKILPIARWDHWDGEL